ncbi:hypothetical protein SASC598P14_001790, partial [Snodgrassella alvi SCGC AB-598-P14]
NLVAPGSDNAVTQPASVSSSQSVKKVTESDDNVPATTDSTPDKNTGDKLTESPVSASQPYWNVH